MASKRLLVILLSVALLSIDLSLLRIQICMSSLRSLFSIDLKFVFSLKFNINNIYCSLNLLFFLFLGGQTNASRVEHANRILTGVLCLFRREMPSPIDLQLGYSTHSLVSRADRIGSLDFRSLEQIRRSEFGESKNYHLINSFYKSKLI